MAKKIYQAKVKFTYEGTVQVSAESRADGKAILDDYFDIAPPEVLDTFGLDDWLFPVRAVKKISGLTILKNGEE